MNEYDSQQGHNSSIRAQVFRELEKNPLNTAKYLAEILHYPYKQYRGYFNKLRYEWKYHHQNERGSKCSNFHCYKAFVCLNVVEQPSRDLALKLGWNLSRARNRFLVFKERLGRVVWFETGRVLLFVRKPGNLGKAKQLFCDGFVNTGLIWDLKVVNPVLDRVRPRSCHYPYETSQRLPRFEIRDFVDSHGILIKVGDRSHPNAVEVIAEVTEFQEKVSVFFDRMVEGLNGNSQNGKGLPKPLRNDYSS